MIASVFIIGLVLGAIVMAVLCERNHTTELDSVRADTYRRAYAKGYEEGAAPGKTPQRKAVVMGLGGPVVSDVPPEVLSHLARRWVRQGQQSRDVRVSCMAWLPVVASVSVPAAWLIFGMSILVVWTVCGAVAFRMESGGYTALDEEAADWLKSRQQTADGKTADRKEEDEL